MISDPSSNWRDDDAGNGECDVSEADGYNRSSQVIVHPEGRERNIETNEQVVAKCQDVRTRQGRIKECAQGKRLYFCLRFLAIAHLDMDHRGDDASRNKGER